MFLVGNDNFRFRFKRFVCVRRFISWLQAGRLSGAIVVGLATTNSREAIADKADYVIDDFRGMTYEKLLTITSRYI